MNENVDRMKNIFYVYVYLDPRKPGSFDYGEFHFDFEPFYVGKGQGVQWQVHLGLAQSKTYKKSYKVNKIRKIQSLGLKPIIIKYKENLTEQEAFDLEKKLIKTIGRLDLGQGSLTNLTDGGDGVSGVIGWSRGKTKETHLGIASRAEKLRGRTKETDPGLASMAEKLRGRTKFNDPSIARQAEKKRGRTKENDSGYAKISEKLKGRSTWCKGKTKETDLGVSRRSKKMAGHVAWNKGLTSENDKRVAKQGNRLRSWNLGKTKLTDDRVLKQSESMKTTLQSKKMRGQNYESST